MVAMAAAFALFFGSLHGFFRATDQTVKGWVAFLMFSAVLVFIVTMQTAERLVS